MSPKGRPEGEYRSAQREGRPISVRNGGGCCTTIGALE